MKKRVRKEGRERGREEKREKERKGDKGRDEKGGRGSSHEMYQQAMYQITITLYC